MEKYSSPPMVAIARELKRIRELLEIQMMADGCYHPAEAPKGALRNEGQL